MNEKKLKKQLELLENEEDVRFQIELTRIIEENQNIDKTLVGILSECVESETEKRVAYAAFVGLCIYHRRFKNITEHGLLFDRYGEKFRYCKTYHLFLSLYYMARESPESIVASLGEIKIAISKLDNHNGVRAAYADIVSIAHGQGVEITLEDVQDAIYEIEKAIRSDPRYAKYHFLRGKLAFVQNDLNYASMKVKHAIDTEDSSRVTYALRIGEYQKLELDISLKKALNKIENRVISMEHEGEIARREISETVMEARESILTQLGFFAGVLAIILTAVNVTSNQTQETAIIILLMLSGIILVSWSALLCIGTKRQNIKSVVLVVLVGMMLISAGVLLHIY